VRETTATLRLLGGGQGAGTPIGEGKGWGHIVLPLLRLLIKENSKRIGMDMEKLT